MESKNDNIKPMAIVSNPERIRIMLDETRLSILRVMRLGIYRGDQYTHDFTVAEIAERMETNPQRIYHHVDKLVEHDFLIKSREEKKKRSIITYYQRTAQGFVISYNSDEPLPQLEDRHMQFINSIIDTFDLSVSDDELRELGFLMGKLLKMESNVLNELNSVIKSKCNVDKNIFYIIQFVQHLQLIDNEESYKIYKNLSNILLKSLNNKK